MKNTPLPFILALVSALFFGAATPISKPLLAHLSNYHLAGLLYLGAALGVLPILLRERKFHLPWRMDRDTTIRLAGSILFGGILGPLALLAGLRLASAASVSMWLNLETVFTALLGHFIFKDYLTPRCWVAAGGILFAAVILAAGEGAAGLEAGLLVALACLCWGLDNHFTALIDGISPAESTFWKGLTAGLTNLLIGLSLAPMIAAPQWITAGLAIGFVSYGLSIVLYITAAQRLGATRSQLIFSSAPFWGVLLSVFLLREPFSLKQLAATIILALAIILMFREQHQHHHTHVAQAHEHLHAHEDGHHTHSHPGLPPATRHLHPHAHPALTHSHAHWPDLHHRHLHAGGETYFQSNLTGSSGEN